jgi:hypothetical protein
MVNFNFNVACNSSLHLQEEHIILTIILRVFLKKVSCFDLYMIQQEQDVIESTTLILYEKVIST